MNSQLAVNRKAVVKIIVVALFIVGFWNDIQSTQTTNLLDDVPGGVSTATGNLHFGSSSKEQNIRLIHVISPYVVPSEKQHVYPLDLPQWAAMESIRRALLHVPDTVMEVEFVCAVFKPDVTALAKANLPCHRIVLLNRSTQSVYPKLKPNVNIPFIADILEAATSTSNMTESDATFFVLLTNADIGFSKNLYGTLYKILQQSDAVSINRVTILTDREMNTTYNGELFLERHVDPLLSQGYSHPGFDFFCMKSTVLERVSVGDFFLGRPPWGANVHLMLNIMAENYTNIKSNPHGTFHIGHDVTKWNRESGYEMSSNASKVLAMFCPNGRSALVDELSEQNLLNCARWFLGKHKLQSLSKTNASVYVPGFVRPGFEQLYLRKYSKYLSYTDWGIPQMRYPDSSRYSNKRKRGEKLLNLLSGRSAWGNRQRHYLFGNRHESLSAS